MAYKFEHRINRTFKYVHSSKTNIRKTISRELKRLGERPVIRVQVMK